MAEQSSERFVFGPFLLDTAEHRLTRQGRSIPLTPKTFDLLSVLVRNSGHLLTKDELLEAVWPHRVLEEGALNRCISVIRKALNERADGTLYIETVPKRGYRFVAPVAVLANEAPARLETETLLKDDQPSEIVAATTPTIRKEAPSRGTPTATGWRALPRGWHITAGVLGLVAGLLTLAWTSLNLTDVARPRIESLAVLPLENLSADPGHAYLADGITEALRVSLSELAGLRIFSATSSRRFDQGGIPLPDAARAYGVDAVIEGSVRRTEDRIWVSVHLVHAPTDTHLWTGRFEREAADVPTLQQEIAQAIAHEIRFQAAAGGPAPADQLDPAAYEQYIIGRYHFWRYNEGDLRRAIEAFERATAIDPTYAAAYAGLARAWWARGIWGETSFEEAEGPAREAARKALELNDRLAEAHVVKADVLRLFDRDWEGAEASVRRALELEPSRLEAHHTYALLLMALGRFSEALVQSALAERLDPLNPAIQSNFGRVLYRARRHDEAIERLNRAIELEPRHWGAYGRLADVYADMEKYDDALAMLDGAAEGGSRPSDALRAAWIHALAGRHALARRLLLAQLQLGESPSSIEASVHVALGDHDEAFRVLFAFADVRTGPSFIQVDPRFDALHGDARWVELLRKLNLPAEWSLATSAGRSQARDAAQ